MHLFLLCTVTWSSWFAIVKVLWVMLQVKMPRAYMVISKPAVLQQGDETTNNIAVVQSNFEDKINLTVLCELALESVC